jgi:multidrug transporter EmrE-like cation transporter
MAARVLDPIIQFSLTAVGGIVLNLLLGAICFKEKITVKSVAAITIAAISVVMINYFN